MAEVPRKFLQIGAQHISTFSTLGGLENLSRLASERNTAAAQGKRNFEPRKLRWIQCLKDLHATVENQLEKLIQSGIVQVSRGHVELNEEHIGVYEAPVLTLIIGDSMVKLQPRGTLVVGAFGRVDLEGPGGKTLLVLEGDEGEEASETPFENQKLTWKIVLRSARAIRLELTADNLADAISSVM